MVVLFYTYERMDDSYLAMVTHVGRVSSHTTCDSFECVFRILFLVVYMPAVPPFVSCSVVVFMCVYVHVPRNLRICAISRLRCAFSES